DPALPRTRHAADDDWQRGIGAHCPEVMLEHFGEAVARQGEQALVAAPFDDHFTGSVEQPGAEARRAPVDRRESRRLSCHRKPPSTISVCAVSMREASEARNSTGPTRSSAFITSLMHCLPT